MNCHEQLAMEADLATMDVETLATFIRTARDAADKQYAQAAMGSRFAEMVATKFAEAAIAGQREMARREAQAQRMTEEAA